jgi:hypothetical protein
MTGLSCKRRVQENGRFTTMSTATALPPAMTTSAPVGAPLIVRDMHVRLAVVRAVALAATDGSIDAALRVSKTRWDEARELAGKPGAPTAESFRQWFDLPWADVLEVALSEERNWAQRLVVRKARGGSLLDTLSKLRKQVEPSARHGKVDPAIPDGTMFWFDYPERWALVGQETSPINDDVRVIAAAAARGEELSADTLRESQLEDTSTLLDGVWEGRTRASQVIDRITARVVRKALELAAFREPGSLATADAYDAAINEYVAAEARLGRPDWGFPPSAAISAHYGTWPEVLENFGIERPAPAPRRSVPDPIDVIDSYMTRFGAVPSQRQLYAYAVRERLALGRLPAMTRMVEKARVRRAARGEASPTEWASMPPELLLPPRSDVVSARGTRTRSREECVASVVRYLRDYVAAGVKPTQRHYILAQRRDRTLIVASAIIRKDGGWSGVLADARREVYG